MNRIVLNFKPVDHQISEQYKKLRENLLFCGKDKKAVALTSCSANEGESEIALQLAVSFAQTGKRTLLIDGNMRKHSVINDTKQGSGNIPGLSEYLSGKNELKEIINLTDAYNMCIIYAGEIPENPSELLGNARFSSAIQALRKIYDHIIINTPPAGRVIDGAVIAENCDGAVLVISDGNVDYRIAQSVKEEIEKSGCSVIGAILNKADKRNILNAEKYGIYGAEEEGGDEQ